MSCPISCQESVQGSMNCVREREREVETEFMAVRAVFMVLSMLVDDDMTVSLGGCGE
jgi:hypothetical protein